MGRWLVVALSVVVGSLAVASATSDSIRADLLIRHVSIIDVTGGPTFRDQRITIAGERIVSITPETPSTPDEATVVDAGGAFVIPGLWDMHQHVLEYPGLSVESVPDATFPLYLANGVLGVRDMGTHDFATRKRLRDDITAGKVQGPRLVIAGRESVRALVQARLSGDCG